MSLELMTRTRSHDVSGFGVFSHGDAGQAHVMAHRMLDEAGAERALVFADAMVDANAAASWAYFPPNP
ncbi:MAG: hypothetical protein ACERK0_14400, partial [Deltaproteobacteria bacterium]